MKQALDKLPDPEELRRIRYAFQRRRRPTRNLRVRRLICVLSALGLSGVCLAFALQDPAPQPRYAQRWAGGVEQVAKPQIAHGEEVEIPNDPPRGDDFVTGNCCGEQPLVILDDKVEVTTELPKGTDLSSLASRNLDASVVDVYGVNVSPTRAALLWLERHQSSDGAWSEDGHAGREGALAATSLALMAFLDNGHTHRFGLHKRTVSQGLRWLKDQQRPDGAFGLESLAEPESQALAAMTLCEAFAVSRDYKLKKAARRALAALLEDPGANSAASPWRLLAYKAARVAGFEVPLEAFKEAARRQSGPAALLLGRLLSGAKVTEPEIKDEARALLRTRPLDQLEWYLGARVLFQIGGAPWKTWNKSMTQRLDSSQVLGGCENGSWDPIPRQDSAAGRVRATASAALSFGIYHCYQR